MTLSGDLESALTAAVAGVRSLHAKLPAAVPEHVPEAVRRVLDHGGSIHQIATRSDVAAADIIVLIDDAQTRADAYAAELARLESEADAIRRVRTRDARARLAASGGRGKSALARSFRVTRVTLDEWLSRDV